MRTTTGLAFNAATGKYYRFEFGVVYQSAATTTGIQISMTIPAVTIFSASVMGPVSTAADGTASIFRGWITSSADPVIVTGTPAVGGASGNFFVIIEGIILASTGGQAQVTHASEISGSNITIKQGSWGIVDTLA